MKYPHTRWLAVLPALLLAAALSGCANEDKTLLIPGLSLPKDSEVISQTETVNLEGRVEFAPFPGGTAKVLVVQFNNPHGWPTVAAHTDILLNDRGYRDVMGDLRALFGTL